MLRPRIIPCLLFRDKGLVKTVKFDASKYIGDPINAVKIFNEKEADELIFLDIDATVNGTPPDFSMIQKLAAECRMPLCVMRVCIYRPPMMMALDIVLLALGIIWRYQQEPNTNTKATHNAQHPPKYTTQRHERREQRKTHYRSPPSP